MPIQRITARSTMLGSSSYVNKKNPTINGVSSHLDETTPAALAGTLTTRTSNVAGVVTTTNSPAGIIATNDLVAVGWIDAAGVLRWAWRGTATVAGSAITIAGLSGDVLPIATFAVFIAKVNKKAFNVIDTNALIAMTLNTANAKAFIALGKVADVENVSPDVTKVIKFAMEGTEDAKFLEQVVDFTNANSLFVSADTIYFAALNAVQTNVQCSSISD